MNRTVWAFALSSLLGFASAAQAYQVAVEAFVTPTLVTAEACNTQAATTVACTVNAVGVLNVGYEVYGTATLILAPGVCDYAYVYTTTPYFFVNGYGTANCVPYGF